MQPREWSEIGGQDAAARAVRERWPGIRFDRASVRSSINMNYAMGLARTIDWRFLEDRFSGSTPGAAAADSNTLVESLT